MLKPFCNLTTVIVEITQSQLKFGCVTMVWQSDIFLRRVYFFKKLLWNILFMRKVTINVRRSM